MVTRLCKKKIVSLLYNVVNVHCSKINSCAIFNAVGQFIQNINI